MPTYEGNFSVLHFLRDPCSQFERSSHYSTHMKTNPDPFDSLRNIIINNEERKNGVYYFLFSSG